MVAEGRVVFEITDGHLTECRAPTLRKKQVIDMKGLMPVVLMEIRRLGFVPVSFARVRMVGAAKAQFLKRGGDALKEVAWMLLVKTGIRIEVTGHDGGAAADKGPVVFKKGHQIGHVMLRILQHPDREQLEGAIAADLHRQGIAQRLVVVAGEADWRPGAGDDRHSLIGVCANPQFVGRRPVGARQLLQ